ncbi:accessory factor UbiK family protein [Pseudidiomarina terrestris]|uniref:Ubiquinone biosynthesis accessory factor UbiK n=1 Tax=Pseudidiomarina terrestris TaxID=2820060 RepID=A0AAW7QZG5_9GAMM|nr:MULTISPECIES: accessory factor UbiK family protein [unclassified Pseudidiomarina]MDN7125615.1 accessory factor UbiK family protein [Pseudidiomarina sp. 1APP75-32.1]MDN7126135.1 accessory factor UbiK family protein [Pseudidiomarina sp. 1APR75-33.1]MDN7130521.1 accessory factor UbiK family protein [Pseudidiomarina sp. 1APR75-15]MDN7134163.1 accessory factor UbiK family protein [Pseudidiomarina sp. 1ASP75-5]MDN7137150.1 accessory factor UbiK family protein [Pseudidiomarina sp. 1ASP75-14]
MDAKKIEDIAKQINDSIPAGMKDFAGSMEQRTKQILQQQLSKLDVVTHEELDIQQQLLLRLRQRVEELEKQVQALQQDKEL